MGPRPVYRDRSQAVCVVACLKSPDTPSLSHKHQCMADWGAWPCAGFDLYRTLCLHRGFNTRGSTVIPMEKCLPFAPGEPGNPRALPYRMVLLDHFVIKIPTVQHSKTPNPSETGNPHWADLWLLPYPRLWWGRCHSTQRQLSRSSVAPSQAVTSCDLCSGIVLSWTLKKWYGFCAKAVLDLPHFQEKMLNESHGLTVNLWGAL